MRGLVVLVVAVHLSLCGMEYKESLVLVSLMRVVSLWFPFVHLLSFV